MVEEFLCSDSIDGIWNLSDHDHDDVPSYDSVTVKTEGLSLNYVNVSLIIDIFVVFTACENSKQIISQQYAERIREIEAIVSKL
jgi:hypothetical protein